MSEILLELYLASSNPYDVCRDLNQAGRLYPVADYAIRVNSGRDLFDFNFFDPNHNLSIFRLTGSDRKL